MKKQRNSVTSEAKKIGKSLEKLNKSDITEADIIKEQAKIEAANKKLAEMRETIAMASANLPKVRLKEIKRTLHSNGILQGEQCVELIFDKDAELLSIPEIESRVMDRSGKGCRMLHFTGDFMDQDRREMLALVEYFPDYYSTMYLDGKGIINDLRPPFGHVQVPYSKEVNKRNWPLFSSHDELLFHIDKEADYNEFLEFYNEKGKAMTEIGVKLILIPNPNTDMLVRVQEWIVKDDVRARYSFPIHTLVS